MKITKKQLTHLVLKEMAHKRDPMRDRYDKEYKSPGEVRSLAGSDFGDPSSGIGIEDFEPMTYGRYEHDIRNEEEEEGRLVEAEAFETYLKTLEEIERLQSLKQELEESWGFSEMPVSGDENLTNESIITRSNLRSLVAEAMGKSHTPQSLLDAILRGRGTEFVHVPDPYRYVEYDEDGDEFLSSAGEDLLKFKATLQNLAAYRDNKESLITNNRFMDGLIEDMEWSLTNLANLQGIEDNAREGLGKYIQHMYVEIMNDLA
tara:strand:+ start:1330 stop:2112 length:783 start_codon:yes stop_codon:yes gene_type:complete